MINKLVDQDIEALINQIDPIFQAETNKFDLNAIKKSLMQSICPG